MSNQEPQEENKSEVAHFLRMIDLEYRAAKLGLYGVALGTSQHEFITKRMENMERFREKIEDIVGKDEAARLVVQQLEESDKAHETNEEDTEKTQELKDEGDNEQ